ncbi:hypothetical protein G4H13_45980 [Streptomyces rapamycinicus]|uniref:Uncharacterized protein n=2 Tax=Streptomyces rhizosphaericus TaxID=114699 RepID=A0A6G4AVM1_9ACTN|nr:hypothetical protein [Streptomyces rhizosphaericus]
MGAGMLFEELSALATEGGRAVVRAVGTAFWPMTQRRAAELVGRGDAERVSAELVRLDRTAQALTPPPSGDAGAERARQEGLWAGRFEALLDRLEGTEQSGAAAELCALLESLTASVGDTAIDTGNATARDGSSAITGIRNVGGSRPGPSKVAHTGDAEAAGPGSSAVTGIVNE